MEQEEDGYKDMIKQIQNDDISKDRSNFIDTAVKVEFLVNGILAFILGINEPDKSKSFGDTTQALSFMAKVTLLNDLDFIDNGVKTKLEIFAGIRNKFAHRYEASSNAAAISSSKYKELEKIYKKYKDHKEDESHNKSIFVEKLIEDVESALEGIISLTHKKLVDKATSAARLKILEDFFNLVMNDQRFISSRAYLSILYQKATNGVTQQLNFKGLDNFSAL